jgi:methylated-DNA-[protein]-cysteine S-methyltransferase
MPVAPGRLLYSRIGSPLGEVLVIGRRGVLTGLFINDHERRPKARCEWVEDDRAFEEVRCQLGEYFRGTRTTFKLRIDLAGTPFQLRVWRELLDIPFGQTTTYGALAHRIGRCTAARAVGAANGRNPISIIVPCHRVIGADGALTGYGWNTERKAWLLDHERAKQTPFAASPPLDPDSAGENS